MKIALLGNFDNQTNSKMEEGIEWAFQQEGYETERYHEADFNEDELVNSDADLLLFFKGSAMRTDGLPTSDMQRILSRFPGKKVRWYFDKVEFSRERLQDMHGIIPYTDLTLITDRQFVNRNNYINLLPLRMGIDERWIEEGTPRDEFKYDIVFAGSIYGERYDWVKNLKKEYGDRFGFFHDVFDHDLNDLAASAKIMVAPIEPQNDLYWSGRIYHLLARGAFLVHPNFHELDLKEGKHFVGYHREKDMYEKINEYLEKPKERKKIAKAGQKEMWNHTFRQTIRDMMAKL